ncbi:MAG TPA: orotidine-5'-phosphate decarboxylase [Solirubrobacterales bacterium]|nr:orotidine-5'-phosphate decarboxylase [Solirubrobacterales bacterium]
MCLGLDPDPAKLAGEGQAPASSGATPAEQAGAAVLAHCRDLIERAGPACVAVKPQLACFERLGAPGWAALAEVIAVAQDAGLLVVADGKRGDVPVTAAAYAQALVGETPTPWGPVPGLGADAFTANPLLGRDALEPLIAAAAEAGAGVFALVRTSNPGAADFEDLPAPDAPLHERLAGLVDELSERLLGEGGLSGMGAVVGATEPEHIGRLRDLMPRSVFLIPGVGAQGGQPQLLGAAFSAGPASALVAASRGIAADPDPAAAAERLRATVWEISTS